MCEVVQIAKKDLRTFFLTPQAAVIFTGFLLLAEYFFLNYLGNFNLAIQKASAGSYLGMEKINLNQWVVENYYMTLMVFNIILIPLIIIRSVVEEKKQGTWDLLLNYPLSDWQLAKGKYLGTLLPVFIMQLVAGVLPFSLLLFANVEVPIIFTGLLALLLNCSLLVAGCLALSFVCNNPLTAGFLSFIFISLAFSLQLVLGKVSVGLAQFINLWSPLSQAKSLIRGELSLESLSFHFLLIIVCLVIFKQLISFYRHTR